MTAKAAADALGISKSGFAYHKNRGTWSGCFRMVKGTAKYDLAAVQAAYAAHADRTHHAGRHKGVTPELAAEAESVDLEHKEARLEQLKLKNENLLGDLFDLERARALCEKFEKHTRGILEALPAMLADELAAAGEPEDVEAIVRTAVDSALAEIYGGPAR